MNSYRTELWSSKEGILEFLATWKPYISRYLSDFLTRRRLEFADVNRWGADVIDRLLPFVAGGKMLRGALVQLASADQSGEAHPEAIKPAVAMELVQAFLLIHDDIMDRDATRRGSEALYAQYESVAESEGMPNPEHYGISMGICAGDVATFLSTEILAETAVDPATSQRMMALFSREIAHVGLAQMGDLTNALRQDGVDAEAIEAIYRHKTGRYTFSLPLMLGAMVRGTSEEELSALERFGELAGVAFQLKDDELGLLADAKTLGKPIGSDITENKKTMHRLLLFDAASEYETGRLDKIFGADSVSAEDLEWVRVQLKEQGVIEKVRRMMERYRMEAEEVVRSIAGFSDYARDSLIALLEYNESRRH